VAVPVSVDIESGYGVDPTPSSRRSRT